MTKENEVVPSGVSYAMTLVIRARATLRKAATCVRIKLFCLGRVMKKFHEVDSLTPDTCTDAVVGA